MERRETPIPETGVTTRQQVGPQPGEIHRPLCSVVIPSYNGRHLLERCLDSIARHRPRERGRSIEIIVSDDGSTDGTVQWLRDRHPDVRVVGGAVNQGFCAAANAGMAAARGPFIQLLNNDTEVTAGWIEAGLAPFADMTVGAVAPLVLVTSEPDRVDSAGDSYSLIGWPTKRGHGQPASRFAGRPFEEVFGASGSSAFYRTRALGRTGGYDPLYGSYYEDIDLSFRLRWAGYRCVFASGCRILHDVSASYDHANERLQRRMSRNAELVFWANLPASVLAIAVVPHAGFVAAQAAWRLARGRLRPFLQGKCDALQAWREIAARRGLRIDLANHAVNPPHFRVGLGSIGDVRNHLIRPRGAENRHPTRASRSSELEPQ
jgi:GT2 family glycosyltransferase